MTSEQAETPVGVSLNEQIKIAREKAGLSQEELAAKLGVTKGAVVWWENGEHSPRLPKLRLMEEILQTQFDATGSRFKAAYESSFATPVVADVAVAFSMLKPGQQAAVATLLRCFLEDKLGTVGVLKRFPRLAAAAHTMQFDVAHVDVKKRNIKM